MAYNTKLEEKIDSAVSRWKDVDKKKMFGGICWFNLQSKYEVGIKK